MVKDATKIKEAASNLGFLACGITKAEFLESEAPRLEKWLKSGFNGEMKWMENHFDKRLDPSKLVPGAKSVISLLYNYFPAETQKPDLPKISKYAYGQDYHFVVKDKLRLLIQQMEMIYGHFSWRVFVDSAPVMERALAAKAGLGWIGKHSLLLNKNHGSFFFIGEIICDLDLEVDSPTTDHCGTCTACIDACPTDAIVSEAVVDANKCISYLTIELRNEIPKEFNTQMDNWAFGCDICQDVCPWNRFSKPHTEESFTPIREILGNNFQEWMTYTEEKFNQNFQKSALLRTGYKGLMKNLNFIQPTLQDGSKGDTH